MKARSFVSLPTGIGMNILIGPSMVSMGHYFVKMRSRAMTVTSCGGCIGMIVVPILIQKLVEHYSVRGALLVYGAFSLHLILTGAFLRPVKTDDSQEPRDIEGKEREYCGKSSENCTAGGKGDVRNHDVRDKTNIPECDPLWRTGTGGTTEVKCEVMDVTESKTSGMILNNFDKHKENHDVDVEYDLMEPCEAAYNNNCSAPSGGQESEGRKTETRKGGFIKVAFDTVDFSLLKNPLFLLILISGTMSAIPYMTMTMFLVPLIESRGISRDTAAILLSVMGGCDIVGRLVCGALADRRPVQPKHVIVFTSVLAGILCSVLYVVKDFYGFLGVIMSYGMVCSAPSILIVPATIPFVGLPSLPKAVGVLLFFCGIAIAIAPSLLGKY